MINKLSGWDDTIVALATAPGVSAIGVIRLSGENSFPIVNELFPSKDLAKQKSHTVHVGLLSEEGAALDEVVLTLYKGPRSFTGEDTIEISCHGSPFIQQQIIEACVRKGARMAKPGEFTQRAFLNGKMDLTQAEAVADIILSNTRASQKTALHNIRGGFSTELSGMREQLIQFAALIELELDFATEDVEFADRSKFIDLVQRLSSSTRQLLASFQLGNVIKNGVTVAIIGKPNAGKSTLLNALLNEERAIVSDIAGTTRDTIEETLNIEGVLFRLIDTAGIREHTTDAIESMGIERSKQNAAKADIILHLIDLTDAGADADTTKDYPWLAEFAAKTINVFTKADQVAQSSAGTIPENAVAAKTGEGVQQLRQRIFAKAVDSSLETEATIITNARHYAALKEVAQSLREIEKGLASNLPGDLLALEFRSCLYWLGEITGEVTNEDKLDYIFSKFCIGK
jgi:tRNA modification GTPase